MGHSSLLLEVKNPTDIRLPMVDIIEHLNHHHEHEHHVGVLAESSSTAPGHCHTENRDGITAVIKNFPKLVIGSSSPGLLPVNSI